MLYFSDDFELWGNELGGCFDDNENEVDDHRGKSSDDHEDKVDDDLQG